MTSSWAKRSMTFPMLYLDLYQDTITTNNHTTLFHGIYSSLKTIYLYVHPYEKVIRMFFQNQIWSRLLDINRLCLVCIKRSIGEVKSAKYLRMVITRGRVMKHWKKHDVNFAMSSSVTALWRRWVSLTIKCTVLSRLLLISQTSEASVLFDDLQIWFCISDIFVNYKLLNKSK